MSTKLVCDQCDAEIDESTTYVSAQVVHKQLIDGIIVTAGQQQLDWHTDHAPVAAAEESEP
jgi:hypothetical protein